MASGEPHGGKTSPCTIVCPEGETHHAILDDERQPVFLAFPNRLQLAIAPQYLHASDIVPLVLAAFNACREESPSIFIRSAAVAWI